MPSLEEHPETSELLRRIFTIDRLSTLPQVVWQLMGALRDERTAAVDLQRIIESDAALASKVLSLANSAYYGLRMKISTIERAIVIIGFQELEFLALSTGLANLFDFRKAPSAFDGEALWIHSLSVAWTARRLAEETRHSDPGAVMLAGLLHDVGKLVLGVYLPKELKRILGMVEEGLPYYRAEEEVGVPHSVIGYFLARKWGLPNLHTAAIRQHHSPKPDDPDLPSTCLVILANNMVKAMGLGMVNEAPPLDQKFVLSNAGVTEQKMEALAEEMETRLPDMMECWLQLLGKTQPVPPGQNSNKYTNL
jgi:putative nucleotidyltransferase with HDIG domain